jgi:hypothetical protein
VLTEAIRALLPTLRASGKGVRRLLAKLVPTFVVSATDPHGR